MLFDDFIRCFEGVTVVNLFPEKELKFNEEIVKEYFFYFFFY